MNRVINRAKSLLILVILLTAGIGLFFLEFAVYGQDWVMFPGSPHVYGKTGSGNSIVTDREGQLLLDIRDTLTYSSDEALRTSMIHWLGDRQGNISAPILSHYAKDMVGYNLISGVYDYSDAPGHIQLSLSSTVQKAALKAMEDYKGTVAVYNYKNGELICAVSTPAFDPDNVPDITGDTTGAWTGAYLNRFLKSAYTPGSIFKIVTAVAALETIPGITQQRFVCEGVREYGIDKVTCMAEHGELTFDEAFLRSCNCSFAQIADQLGGEVLQQYAQQLGITQSLSFDGVSTVAGKVSAEKEAPVMVAWSAIGQHKNLINPCQFLTLVGTIANGGSGVAPHVVSQVSGGSFTTQKAEAESIGRIMSRQTAQILGEMMRNNVENSYGDENFAGFTVCAKSGTAELGADKKPNAMFTGFVTDEDYPLAFIVCVEEAGFGKTVCVPILEEILVVCREILG